MAWGCSWESRVQLFRGAGTREGTRGLFQGFGFYRAGGGAGLEAAPVCGVVTKSHGQRW